MAKRTVVLEGDPSLRKKSRPVENFDQRLWTLLDDMAETLKEAGGIGLAAPQVGILRRVHIISMPMDNVEDEVVTEYINPEIIFQEDEQEGREGCLSLPGEWGIVKRPHHVKIRAQNRNGAFFEKETFGLEAVCMCHETDHLDGILYVDKAVRMIDPNEDNDDDEYDEDGQYGIE